MFHLLYIGHVLTNRSLDNNEIIHRRINYSPITVYRQDDCLIEWFGKWKLNQIFTVYSCENFYQVRSTLSELFIDYYLYIYILFFYLPINLYILLISHFWIHYFVYILLLIMLVLSFVNNLFITIINFV